MIETYDAAAVAAALPWEALVGALGRAFARRGEVEVPLRHHHARGDDTLLLMPAWDREHVGLKVLNVVPANGERGQPTVQGSYLLTSAVDGSPLAVLDGAELTARRTAAASVLAATRLARRDASRLVVVGAGRIARELADAYCAMFPVEQVVVWNRHPARAAELAARLRGAGLPAHATDDLGRACRAADVITCATPATDPLVAGDWLPAGVHLDLVGGFTPEMRETDDEAVQRCRVFVDTREGASAEAGDVVQPLRTGIISESDVLGDLFDLSSGTVPGRLADDDRTLFKSVGHALEDLVAATIVHGTAVR